MSFTSDLVIVSLTCLYRSVTNHSDLFVTATLLIVLVSLIYLVLFKKVGVHPFIKYILFGSQSLSYGSLGALQSITAFIRDSLFPVPMPCIDGEVEVNTIAAPPPLIVLCPFLTGSG